MSSGQKFDPKDYHGNPIGISRYLNEALAGDDLRVLTRAIGDVMRAQNVMALSEEAGLRRESVYRMFSGDRDPTLGNTMKMLAALGVQLVVKPRTVIKTKPPRPKLGRPRSRPID